MRGQLPDIFPSSGAQARHLPPQGEGFCVAAIPVMRTNGQTARNGQDRSLQTCRKRRTITGLRGNKNTPPGRGGALPRPRFCGCSNITGKPHYGFPLWGKLSPQVTDEGATSGHFPLIRRVPRHLPPRGEGFCVAAIPITQLNGQAARNGQDRSLQTCRKSAIHRIGFSTFKYARAAGIPYLNSKLLTLHSPPPLPYPPNT